MGASAGGLEALEQFFRSVPQNSGVAYVVIQHLSSDHKSMMGELLSRHTQMTIKTVEDGVVPEPDSLWLIPPGQGLEIVDGRFALRDRPPGLHLPIDLFLQSAAKELGDSCVAVILSGTGSDGSRGLRTVKEAGGFVLAQDPRTARFAGMPENAIATGFADIVLAPEMMPEQILSLLKGKPVDSDANIEASTDPESTSRGYARIFELLKISCGVDFSAYKPTTVSRRVLRRMAIQRMTQLDEYVQFLAENAAERESLFHELLIGVTSFFRDEEKFEKLREDVITPLLKRKKDDTIRIWVPGCSTGEEAYTLAMIIHEEAEKQARSVDVKIFASDIDQRALDVAGRGVYPNGVVADLSPERASKFFRPADGGMQVIPTLRSMVLFARHDVTSDPPFTKLDLISCRNLLIYLAQETQAALFAAFHAALREGGGLYLGTSETAGADAEHWLRSHTDMAYFEPIGDEIRSGFPHDRAYGRASLRDKSPAAVQSMDRSTPVTRAATALIRGTDLSAILVDEEFKVLHVFGDAGTNLRMPDGTPVLNILHMTPQPLSAILASGIPRVIRSGKAITYRDIHSGDTDTPSRLRILPSPERENRPEALIVFEDHPDGLIDHARIDEVHLDSDTEVYLTDLQAELQHAREGHQALVEELASSNEELQASNEELLASNEELQATNEELQSVNEELHTLNNEYQRKIQQLEELSADLDSLFEATDIGTLFLDDDLAIRRFTPSMCSLLPLMSHDVGRSVTHFSGALGHGFLDELQSTLRTGEARERTFQLKSVPVLVRIMRVQLQKTHGLVVTFIDVSVVERVHEVTRRVLNIIPAQVALLSEDAEIMLTNASWDRFALENGADPARVGVGTNYLEVCTADSTAGDIVEGVRSVLKREKSSYTVEYPCHSPTKSRWFLMDCKPSEEGGAVVTHFDVTERKLAELRLQDLATTDPLTGVYNRRGLDDVLAKEMDQVRRLGVPLTAVMIDCDDFKVVNDRLGHAAGDVILRDVVDKMRHELRSTDVIARVGGDEFMVLLPETSAAEAKKLAERLRLAVAGQPIALSDETIKLSISMAVAQADLEVQRAQDLMERSRYALNASKRRGKNRVTIVARSGEEVRDVNEAKSMLQEILDDAGALATVGQPIVDLATRRMTGVELLSRSVYHSDMVPTTLFRTAIEEEMLTALDRRCFGNCLRTCAQMPVDLMCSINIYPSTLLNIADDSLHNLLGAAAGRPVCLEISEQQIIGDPAYLLDHVAAAREAGAQIALDDVGFGRTSLEALIVLEPEVVKIDRRFIKGVTESESRRRWLERLVRTAHALGAKTVGEGVETIEELQFLEHLDVTSVQGYYFRPPMGALEIIDLTDGPVKPDIRLPR